VSDSASQAIERNVPNHCLPWSAKLEEAALNDKDTWCSIPGDLVDQHGVIWLKEPACSDRNDLVKRLLGGNYAKPFVVDDGITRRLHFDFRFAQSEMNMDAPYELISPYARKMMAFLLFSTKPRHIVIAGLGGGGLTKFIYRQLPSTRITTVEVNADVIALSDLFGLPRQDARMNVVHADAADFFATEDTYADVILLDGCDKIGIAPTFKCTSFYQNLHARLRPHGVLALNLIGKGDQLAAHLALLAEVFSNKLLIADVSGSANRVVFAFKDAEFAPDWDKIRSRANKLQIEHELDFPRFARLLQRSQRRHAGSAHWY